MVIDTISNSQTLGTQISPTTPSALLIKATQGRLCHLTIGNPNASAVYLKLYNSTSVIMGTTPATLNYYIPASSSLSLEISNDGLFFNNAIQLAVSGAAPLTDNTNITTGCEINYSFL